MAVSSNPWLKVAGRRRAVMLAAGLGGLMLASPLQARPGTVYWTTWLRVGPGDGYAVVDEVAPRSQVDVQDCNDRWCKVAYGQASGYIEASMLSAPDIHAGPPQAPLTGPCVVIARNNDSLLGEQTRVCSK